MRIISRALRVAGHWVILGSLTTSVHVNAQGLRITDQTMRNGFISVPAVLRENFQTYVLSNDSEAYALKRFCDQLAEAYATYKWKPAEEGCGDKGVMWHSQLKSHVGTPLIYAEFGRGDSTTLILGGVHPDELTPIPLVFRFANHLQSNPGLIPAGSRVIIAPLVNPDGFFRKGASRTNARGVDVNRNFFTQDWYSTAKSWWAERRQKNERHFPGHIPNSEIETLYQIWLIDNFKPDKIISIHAPLGFYDYDGPGDQKPRALTSSEEKAKALVQNMSQSSRNYKIVDYSFYPGSLGNYAGNERGIPTVTLELETTNPDKTREYWLQFSPGLEQAVKYPFINPGAPRVKGTSLFLESYDRKTARNVEATPTVPRL
jgi:protein MpaA